LKNDDRHSLGNLALFPSRLLEDGTQNVKVEETTGLPFLEIKIDKAEIARRGLSLLAVQNVIEAAIGGRVAGLVFEGDRRFQIIVRLNDALRNDIAALENLPVQLPRQNENAPAASVPLRALATFEQTDGANQISRENGKRRVVATAEVRGRDIGSLVAEAQAVVNERVKLAQEVGSPGAGSLKTSRSPASA